MDAPPITDRERKVRARAAFLRVSLEQVGQRSGLGDHDHLLRHLRCGDPAAVTIWKVATVLGVSPTWLADDGYDLSEEVSLPPPSQSDVTRVPDYVGVLQNLAAARGWSRKRLADEIRRATGHGSHTRMYGKKYLVRLRTLRRVALVLDVALRDVLEYQKVTPEPESPDPGALPHHQMEVPSP